MSIPPERTGPDEKTFAERADDLEEKLILDMSRIPVKSALYNLADGKLEVEGGKGLLERNPGKYMLMGEDSRLPKMPEKPTLLDFFKHRFASIDHLVQSAAHARRAGLEDKVVAACLLHDVAVGCFIRGDHGYWGSQMLAPYVDEEISWAIRAHQALRFFPDESVGYKYPEIYTKYFGADYKPDAYIEEEYQRARKHKWYMTARMITVWDVYSFDPNVKIDVAEFTDTLGRHFRQPKEGLGFDNSPVAHMWRTILWPTRYL